MHHLRVVFLLLLLLYVCAQQNMLLVDESALIDAPFSVSVRDLSPTALGFEARLKMNEKLIHAGLQDVYVGLKFPSCQRVFQLYVGYGGRTVTREYDIKLPRVCMSDFGIGLPLTAVCFKVKNIVVMPRGAKGDLIGDITIGQSVLQWRNANIPIAKFQIGQDTRCYAYNDPNSCIKDPNCGWCEDGQSCLETRSDHKTDVCKFCPRCSFTTAVNTTYDRMKECLKKESCGFCKIDNKCYAGDSLGPFDMSSTVCDTENIASDSVKENKNWLYEGRSTETGTLVGIGFLGMFIGLCLGDRKSVV